MPTKKSSLLTFSFSLFLLLFLGVHLNTAEAQSSSPEADASLPSLKFGGFLQQQFIADDAAGSPARFSIHRARLGVTGSITERIKINLVGGYAEPPNNTPRLVNAFIDFDIHPLLQMRTGQFLLPFGLEGPQPIFLNPAIERTTAIRRLNTFTMFRGIGIQLSGRQSIFNYALAVVNSGGANQTEQYDPKDVMGRIGITPADDVEIGVSGHLGQYRPNPASDDHENRMRAGVDLSYRGEPMFLRGEYMIRRDDQPVTDSRRMNGGYVLGGYRITDHLESIARYEYYDPDTSSDDDYLTAVIVGANYYFVGNTRLSVNYEFRDDRLNPALGNMLTVQMQIGL